MSEYGFWSLLPPVIAIVLAIRTKQVFVALLFGIWLGYLIISGGNLLTGTIATVQALVDVFKDDGNTRTIIFTLLVGALIAYIQKSGGVDGFIQLLSNFLNWLGERNIGKRPVVVQLIAATTGLFIFVESNISVLTVGTLYRPMFDKLLIPREKLAYIADSTSAPSSILIPFNAWGAFIMSLLVIQNLENPFQVLLSSMPYNFYPIITIGLVYFIILTGRDFGPMKKAEIRAAKEGKVLADTAIPMISEEVTVLEKKEGAPSRAINMLLPIGTMVFMMPLILLYTGWDAAKATGVTETGDLIFAAVGLGSGSSSVLYSVIISLVVGIILYLGQKILTGKEVIDLTLKGMSGMVSLALLMVFAFAIGALCKSLGTGLYVAEVSKSWLSPNLVPLIIFVVSSFIAFSTGTSWGTFAIMISIAVPMAQSFDSNISLAIAAALGGGVFGDHCSPISDTSIISSMASASDHIDHVKTQLPYALVAGGISALLYLILGFML
jgi:tetracycline resistance efflux pump